MAAFPETRSQTRDDGARDEGQADEAADVVRVSQATAAHSLCSKQMAGQTGHEQDCTEPHAAVRCACNADLAGTFHCTLRGVNACFPTEDLRAVEGALQGGNLR